MYINKLFKLIMSLSIVLSGLLLPLEQANAEEVEGVLTSSEKSTLINQGFTDEEIADVSIRKSLTGLPVESLINVYPHTSKNYSNTAVSEITASKTMPNFDLTKLISSGTSKDEGLAKLKHIKLGEMQAPFSIGDGYENISAMDGSLTIMEEDLTLVGRNGLNFDLKRTYNSNQSQYYDMSIDAVSSSLQAYYVTFDTAVFIEKKGYKSIGGVYKDVETRSCTNHTVLKTTKNIPGESLFSEKVYNRKAAETYWVKKLLGSGHDLEATCAKTNNKTYEYYKRYSDGTNKVDESPSWNDEEATGEKEEASSVNFNYRYEAEDFIKLLTKGEQVGISDWIGTDSNGYDRVIYKVAENPAAKINNYSYGTNIEYFNKISKTFLESKFPIGKGWSWNIPYIQIEGQSTVLHFGEVGSYVIENDQLKGYPWKDLTFTQDTTQTVNQVPSKYALKTLEGTIYYFSQTGNLIKIKDSYDNYIEFQYSTHQLYGNVLSEIKNSINNKISISYTETEVTLLQGEKVVKYSKQKSPDGKIELLKDVQDPVGRKTTYDYSLNDAEFNLIGTEPKTANPYVLLVGITHPTGLKTNYSYEGIPYKNKIGVDAVNEIYRVLNRNDTTTYNNNEKLDSNLKTFIYDPNMNGPYSNSYSYTTRIVEEDKTTSFVINRKYDANRGSANYYKAREITEGSTDVKQIFEFAYDPNKHNPNPLKTTKTYENKLNAQKSIPVVTQSQYNDYGKLTSDNNELGFETKYEYDPTSHLLVGLTEPLTSTKAKYTKYERNGKGSITKETIYENNKDGKVLSNTSYEDFDAYGNIRREVTAFGGREYKRTFEYSSLYAHAFLTKETKFVTDLDLPLQQKQINVQATYYPDTGNLASITDGKGYVTGYRYDKLNRLTTITNPDNSTITYTYIDEKNRIETKDEIGNITFEEWNPAGWKVKEGIKLGSSYDARTIWHYNETGDLIGASNALGHLTQYEYDFLNRITKEINPLGNAKTTQYDDILNLQTFTDEVGNRVVKNYDAVGRETKNTEYFSDAPRIEEFTYNNANQVLTTKDPKGLITTSDYDVLGNLVSVTMPNSEITRYEYDYLGNVTKVTYPDNTISSKQYDESGRMLSKTDLNLRRSTYKYDNNDQMVEYNDRNGNQHIYVYNNRNWLKDVKSYKNGAIVDTVTYEYYLNGARESMDDSTGLTQYVYDSEGHLLNMVYPDGKSISYQYDKQGNKKEIITPFNKKIVYQYNELNQINQLGVDNKVDLVTYDYYPNGQLKNKNLANGLISSYIFDHSNLTEVKRISSLGEIKENYGYDLNKNIENIATSRETNQYTYDALDRVETTTQGNQMYEYDENGNREILNSDIVPILENKTYEYDTNNRLIKVIDDDNQIIYRYNGDGLLYEKEVSNQITRYYYDGDVLLAEAEVQNGQSNLRNHYVTGNDKELLLNESHQLYYFVTDGLENVIELVDATGSISNKYRYDMWGNPVETDENIENSLHYSGELWEETTGLQYLRSRWYDPSLGRFLNEDSFEGELKNPLSLNQYTYVENNSLINYDPNGTFSIKKNSLQGNQGSHGIGKNSKVSVSPGKTPKGTGKFKWGNQKTLQDHFERHGKEFNVKNAQDYAKKANDFFKNRNKYEVKIDTNGVIRVYDSKTNTFGSFNPSGTTRTFYKPESPTYWQRQPGK